VHVVAIAVAAIDPWLDAALDWEPRLPIAATFGRSDSASPRQWTRRNVERVSIGRRRSRLSNERSPKRARPPAPWFSPAPAPITIAPDPQAPLDRVLGAYEEQCAAIEASAGASS
jgi:hypothetical protein